MIIQRIIREYFKSLYPKKLENLEEMYTFLDAFSQLKLKQEDINNLKRSITNNESEAARVSLPNNKTPGPGKFTAGLYQTFKEEVIQTHL
jgi:hypothetical protein